MAFTKEQIAEFLAKKTLEYFNNPEDSINPYQREISDGNININRDPNNPLVVYKSDIKANIEEYISIVVSEDIFSESYDGTVDDGNLTDINSIADFNTFASTYLQDPHNVGQFVEFETSQSIIDPDMASEVLDTDIYELLPPQVTRQEEINKWFQDFDGLIDAAPAFYEERAGSGNYEISSSLPPGPWDDINSVPNSPSASMVRLNSDAPAGDANEGKTIEFLRNYLDTYLVDKDSQVETNFLDSRPDYDHISDGYLKFRGLNQSIFIRNDEGGEIEFAGTDSGGRDGDIPNYLEDGFTITMWVKFLNKVNNGTLFNYGNQFRDDNPHGFMLETFILKKGQVNSNVPDWAFQNTEYERFIRLVVREANGTMRHSHMGSHSDISVNTIDYMIENNDGRLYEYTNIPVDLTEWYFIVANYNIDISEPGNDSTSTDPFYWRWNIDINGSYSAMSGQGSRCKVEVISKSQLLRARGYQVEES